MVRAVLVKPMPADHQIYADQIYLDHFESKIQNNCWSVLCKNCYSQKLAQLMLAGRPTPLAEMKIII